MGCDGTEAMLILLRSHESANHRTIVVRLAIVQHVEPELVTFAFRIAFEVTKIFHQYKRRVVLSCPEFSSLNNITQHLRSCLATSHCFYLLLALVCKCGSSFFQRTRVITSQPKDGTKPCASLPANIGAEILKARHRW